MITKFHTYIAQTDPSARELLTRLQEWQTNKFGRPVVESTDDSYFQYDPERTARAISPSLNRHLPPVPFDSVSGDRVRTSRRNFNVVVAYEDVAAAKRAKEICDRLRCTIGDQVVLEMHLWRWDILKNAGLIDIAVNDAVNARLIILATRGFKDFPADTRTWIELWVPRRRARTGALVLLVEPINSFTLGSSPQVSYLQSVAQRARMEFFASIANVQKITQKKI